MVYCSGAAIDSSEPLPVVSGVWPELKKTKASHSFSSSQLGHTKLSE